MFLKILKRGPLVVIPVLFGAYCVDRAYDLSASLPEAAMWLLFAAAMLILLAIQVAFPVAGMIGDWCARIYLPSEVERPPVNYILAERYERERRWELCLAEYEKILYYHAMELPAHLGRLRVAIRGFEDEKLGRKYLRASLRRFGEGEACDALEREWRGLWEESRKAKV